MKDNLAVKPEEIYLFGVETPEPEVKRKRRRKSRASINIPPINISHTIVVQQEDLFTFQDDLVVTTSQPLTAKPQKDLVKEDKDLQEETTEEDFDQEFEEYEDLTSDEIKSVSEEDQEECMGVIGLSDFFQSIRDITVLTREEEQSLFESYRAAPTQEIRNDIICHNIKLVISVAKKIINKNQQLQHKVSLGDMISEGVFGLYEAIEKFDLKKKYKFSTYAYYWIYQSITRAIANKADVIRIPVHYGDNMSVIRRLENEYMIKHQVEVVPDEAIIEMMMELRKKKKKTSTRDNQPITVEKIKKFRQTTQAVQSLDVEIDESNTTMLEMVSDDESINPESICLNKSLKEDLLFVIKTLSKKEQFIIINRYNLNNREKAMTLEDLSIRFGLTKERIRQIEEKALEKLRHPSRSRVIRDYYVSM